MTFLVGQIAERLSKTLGKAIPQENIVVGLDNLPEDLLRDLETVNLAHGSLYAFAYLYHVADANFGDVKCYIAGRGWGTGVD